MRKCIGSALLVMVLATVPALVTAQRRPPARRAAPAAQHPSFGLQIDLGTQTDFGIGGRGVFGLSSLFPGVPLDGIVSFDYYFPSGAPAGSSLHFWEINGNVAYRFRVPARSSFRPYGGGGLNIAHSSASAGGFSGASPGVGLNILGGTAVRGKGKGPPFARIPRGGGKRQPARF